MGKPDGPATPRADDQGQGEGFGLPVEAQEARPQPVPPDNTGKTWKGRRRYSTQELLRIAKRKGCYILVPDFWITKRKRRHLVFDWNGDAVYTTQNLEEVIQLLRDLDVQRLIIDVAYIPKPAFVVLHDNARQYRGRKDHG